MSNLSIAEQISSKFKQIQAKTSHFIRNNGVGVGMGAAAVSVLGLVGGVAAVIAPETAGVLVNKIGALAMEPGLAMSSIIPDSPGHLTKLGVGFFASSFSGLGFAGLSKLYASFKKDKPNAQHINEIINQPAYTHLVDGIAQNPGLSCLDKNGKVSIVPGEKVLEKLLDGSFYNDYKGVMTKRKYDAKIDMPNDFSRPKDVHDLLVEQSTYRDPKDGKEYYSPASVEEKKIALIDYMIRKSDNMALVKQLTTGDIADRLKAIRASSPEPKEPQINQTAGLKI